jgi:hypothetical protein
MSAAELVSRAMNVGVIRNKKDVGCHVPGRDPSGPHTPRLACRFLTMNGAGQEVCNLSVLRFLAEGVKSHKADLQDTLPDGEYYPTQITLATEMRKRRNGTGVGTADPEECQKCTHSGWDRSRILGQVESLLR